MIQSFILTLATDNLAVIAKKLNVAAEALCSIQITVTASLSHDEKILESNAYLKLSYDIRLASIALTERFNWSTWTAEKVGFADYLWEQTCLECFLTTHATSYIEINACPDGSYALYKFEDYRLPATLPPTPLLQKNAEARACIQWDNSSDEDVQSEYGHYQRRFDVPLAQLPYDLQSPHCCFLINPCVILYFDDTALYFASNHASPPDFHQRRYWSTFNHSSS